MRPVGARPRRDDRRRAPRARLGLRRARACERLEITADVDNIGSQRVALAAGFRREGVLRGYLHGARRAHRRRPLRACCRGDPRPGARRAAAGRPGLAAADGRPAGRPALRAGRRPGRPGRLRRPGRRALDLPAAGAVHARRRRGVHRRRAAAPRRRRARPARRRPTRPPASCSAASASTSSPTAQAAEIGYWIKREARRRGVALAAARLVIDWAFGELGVERLELLTYPGNEASQALAGRLGFTRECLLRGFLAPEPGKSREGRVVPSADGSLPPRDDQVQFVRLRSDPAPRLSAAAAGGPDDRDCAWRHGDVVGGATGDVTRAHRREPPDLAEPAALSGLSPERPFFDPANRLADEVTASYSSAAGAQSSSCLDLRSVFARGSFVARSEAAVAGLPSHGKV